MLSDCGAVAVWRPVSHLAGHGPWSARWMFTAVVVNNSILLIGGNGAADAWLATDPNTWTQLTASATYSNRYSHGCVVLNGNVIVWGGHNGAYHLNDVWAAPVSSKHACCVLYVLVL